MAASRPNRACGADSVKTSTKPFNADHARLIVRANGAPKGQRTARQHELTGKVCLEMRRALGLRPVKPKGVRW